MGLKVALTLIAFLSVFTLGTALKCYLCAGSSLSDCARGKRSAMVIQECSNNSSESKIEEDASPIKQVCLRLYETDFKPHLFARGCGLVPSNVSDACEYIEDLIHIKGCKSCTTDLCNLHIIENVENDIPV